MDIEFGADDVEVAGDDDVLFSSEMLAVVSEVDVPFLGAVGQSLAVGA
jgi:hypothetical protein